MKVIAGLLFFILAGINVYAQQDARVIAEIAAGDEKTIKNSPFSAEAMSESVQVLADGNRIVRNSTTKLYRNSEGRFRREMSGGSGGVFSTHFSFGEGTTILDPVAGQRVMLDSLGKTARLLELNAGQGIAIAGRAAVVKQLSEADRADMENKVKVYGNLSAEEREKVTTSVMKARRAVELVNASPAVAGGGGFNAVTAVGGGYAFSTGPQNKYDTRTEELGTRDFEGVSAEGTRSVTTIPEGAIGNERPIEITYERWYSKELGLVVYSKHSDPRFGEQTYRVTNIVRSEPDPSLFSVPQGYRVLAEPATVYKLDTKLTPPTHTVTAARPASGVRTTSVVNVKAAKP